MKGLDDSKFIIAATYMTSIFKVTSHIGIYSFYRGYLNVYILAVGGNVFIATTSILSLIFIPKVKVYNFPSPDA